MNIEHCMKDHILFFLILLLLPSCNRFQTYDTESTLALAGENRAELEKVLVHFRDSGRVAYESACFLIENMKYHASKEKINLDPQYADYFGHTDSLYHALFDNITTGKAKEFKGKEYDSLRKALGKEFSLLPEPDTSEPMPDAQSLSAEYLIDNIEKALAVWRENGYEYNKDFDFFKEFILPYRATNEYPDMSRTDIYHRFHAILGKGSSIYEQLEYYKTYVDKSRWINKYTKPKGHLGIYDLYVPKFKMDCHNMTNRSCNILRANGIPTVYEFTPLWQDRGNRHFWCVSPDTSGILQPFTAPDNNLREDWESDIRYAGKVYRRTYGAQKDTPYFIAGEDEYIPGLFDTPLLSDQTFRYHQTVTLRLPLNGKTYNNLAYLCMWAGSEPAIVGWGKIDRKRNEIVYEQVPLNTLFFPVLFDEETMLDIARPFIIYAGTTLEDIPLPLTANTPPHSPKDISIENGNIIDSDTRKAIKELRYITLECDTTQHTDLHLLRKYPDKRRMRAFREQLKGAVLVGSDDERRSFDTLLTIKETPQPYLQEYKFKNEKCYRFYRLSAPTGASVNISHMEFLTSSPKGNAFRSPTPLPVFHKDTVSDTEKMHRVEGRPLKTGSHPEYAFDNNMSTYAGSSSVGMEFRHPVQIDRIRLVPRNANNMIVPGNSYLLMYYDNGWKEFKILYAEHNYLDFKRVPKATLYWLRNLTEGKEELPFFYIDGKQYFLHTDKLPYCE